jgi:hypothetical protein
MAVVLLKNPEFSFELGLISSESLDRSVSTVYSATSRIYEDHARTPLEEWLHTQVECASFCGRIYSYNARTPLKEWLHTRGMRI